MVAEGNNGRERPKKKTYTITIVIKDILLLLL